MPAKVGGSRWFPYRLKFVVGDPTDADRLRPDRGEPDRDHADRDEPDADRDEPDIYIDTTDEQTAAAAVGAAVAHVLGRPDTIRHRAQNAATISGALAAALVIAALSQLTGSGTESWNVITVVFVLLAVCAWAGSVALFIYGVTHIDRERTPLDRERTPRNVDYQQLIEDYERYSSKLRRHLKRAARFSGLALLLTVVAIVLEVGERVRSAKDPRQLVLSEGGASAVAELCGWDEGALTRDPRINGRVAANDLSKTIVLVLVDSRPSPIPERCTPARRSNNIRLPRSTILATRDLGP